MTFDRILVARYSPQNGCRVPDESVLVVSSRLQDDPAFRASHFFTDVATRSLRSRYGWVRRVSPFTLDSFIAEHWTGACSQKDVELMQLLFESIARLADDMPVASSYGERGFPNRRLELQVHRVFFHSAGPTA